MAEITDEALMEHAKAVRLQAHAPYSNFFVGAAILDGEGRVHLGVNVENASFPEGACAETGAIAAMVAAGGKVIRRIAVAGGKDSLVACTPCGGCRQRILEFADSRTGILLLGSGGRGLCHYGIAELLPESFSLS